MKPLLPALALAAALLPAPLHADDDDRDEFPRTISVTGEGRAAAPPDLASITTGVVTTAATAGAALDANNKEMASVMATLEGAGIAKRDIQTSNFNVSPQYSRDDRKPNQRPQIIGYQVSNTVAVRVRDLERVGAILDALVEAGSNQLGGISFSIDDPEPLLNEAREKAVANARQRAELYARAAGVKLGEVLTISESGAPAPRPMMMERAAMAMAADSVPIASGEQEIRATIHLVFAIQ